MAPSAPPTGDTDTLTHLYSTHHHHHHTSHSHHTHSAHDHTAIAHLPLSEKRFRKLTRKESCHPNIPDFFFFLIAKNKRQKTPIDEKTLSEWLSSRRRPVLLSGTLVSPPQLYRGTVSLQPTLTFILADLFLLFFFLWNLPEASRRTLVFHTVPAKPRCVHMELFRRAFCNVMGLTFYWTRNPKRRLDATQSNSSTIRLQSLHFFFPTFLFWGGGVRAISNPRRGPSPLQPPSTPPRTLASRLAASGRFSPPLPPPPPSGSAMTSLTSLALCCRVDRPSGGALCQSRDLARVPISASPLTGNRQTEICQMPLLAAGAKRTLVT